MSAEESSDTHFYVSDLQLYSNLGIYWKTQETNCSLSMYLAKFVLQW